MIFQTSLTWTMKWHSTKQKLCLIFFDLLNIVIVDFRNLKIINYSYKLYFRVFDKDKHIYIFKTKPFFCVKKFQRLLLDLIFKIIITISERKIKVYIFCFASFQSSTLTQKYIFLYNCCLSNCVNLWFLSHTILRQLVFYFISTIQHTYIAAGGQMC